MQVRWQWFALSVVLACVGTLTIGISVKRRPRATPPDNLATVFNMIHTTSCPRQLQLSAALVQQAIFDPGALRFVIHEEQLAHVLSHVLRGTRGGPLEPLRSALRASELAWEVPVALREDLSTLRGQPLAFGLLLAHALAGEDLRGVVAANYGSACRRRARKKLLKSLRTRVVAGSSARRVQPPPLAIKAVLTCLSTNASESTAAIGEAQRVLNHLAASGSGEPAGCREGASSEHSTGSAGAGSSAAAHRLRYPVSWVPSDVLREGLNRGVNAIIESVRLNQTSDNPLRVRLSFATSDGRWILPSLASELFNAYRRKPRVPFLVTPSAPSVPTPFSASGNVAAGAFVGCQDELGALQEYIREHPSTRPMLIVDAWHRPGEDLVPACDRLLSSLGSRCHVILVQLEVEGGGRALEGAGSSSWTTVPLALGPDCTQALLGMHGPERREFGPVLLLPSSSACSVSDLDGGDASSMARVLSLAFCAAAINIHSARDRDSLVSLQARLAEYDKVYPALLILFSMSARGDDSPWCVQRELMMGLGPFVHGFQLLSELRPCSKLLAGLLGLLVIHLRHLPLHDSGDHHANAVPHLQGLVGVRHGQVPRPRFGDFGPNLAFPGPRVTQQTS